MKNQEKKHNSGIENTVPSRPQHHTHAERPNTKVESDTGKRPEKDTNPLPPNPNKVDNHDD
jgi:hypothetical protein